MLGVEDYGSDSESETQSVPSTSSLVSKPLYLLNTSGPVALPTLKRSSSGPSSKPSGGLSLPPPKAKTKRPKKITIGLPELPPADDDDATKSDEPPAKKSRVEPGARSSALLSMLPAPKNKAPASAPQERVLGGGRGPGLVFHTSSHRSARTATVEDVEDEQNDEHPDNINAMAVESKSSLPFLPPSLVKGKPNISVEEKHGRPRATVPSTPAVDFFSLSSSSSSSHASSSVRPLSGAISSSAPTLPLLPGVSSAPKVDDFVPPEPTPQDPYPGYYLTPSGAWAAHDPDYYRIFYNKWKREYDEHVRALEKGTTKGFEAMESAGAQEINALQEMEKAKKEIQEREERKALTTDDMQPAAPKMNIKGAALGGRARTRHQLSTLLTEAYQNREALEEQIAQGRRNRKEAGNKYGF